MGLLDAPAVPAAVIPTPTRTQLAHNAGCLVDLTGWSRILVASGGGEIARIAEGSRFACRLPFTANQTTVGGGIQYGRSTSTDIEIPAAGENIAFAASVISSRRQRMVMQVLFYNGEGVQVGSTIQGGSVVVVAQQRGRVTASGAVPAGAVTAVVKVVAIFSGSDGVPWRNGDTLTVTQLMVEKGTSTGPFFTGADTGCAWAGTANASTATTRTPTQVAANFNATPTINGVQMPTQTDLAELANAAPRFKNWVTGMSYQTDDIVMNVVGIGYRCLSQHIASASFLTDYNAGKWQRLTYAQLDYRTPPRAISDFCANRAARVSPRLYPWPLTATWQAAGFSLTTDLGAGFQEFVFNAAPPVRSIGMVGSSVTNAGTTLQQNLCNGASTPHQPYSIEFILTAPAASDGKFVITHALTTGEYAVNPGIYIEIDGLPATWSMMRDPSPVSASYRAVQVTGIPAGTHVVRVTLQSIDWRSIAFTSGATVAATTATKKKLALMGDSWIAGGGTGNAHPTFPLNLPWILGRLLDADPFFMGAGGTGYANPGSFSVYGSSDRLTHLYTAAPDYLFIFGSQNDDSFSSEVQAAATALFSAVATNLPSTKIIVCGPSSTAYDTNTNRQASVTGLKAAAAGASNVIGGNVIDPHNNHWMSGDGHLGSPDTQGIADTHMFTDDQHLTIMGDAYYARRIFEEIVELFLAQSLVTIDGFAL